MPGRAAAASHLTDTVAVSFPTRLPVGTGNRRAASGRGRYLVPSATCAEPVSRLARRSRVLVSLTGTLTLESLLGAVISAIRRGQQLLRVVIGHLG